MKTKVIRDPIHGQIQIYPLEWLIIDTPIFQRLRYISQLVGAQFVFPGCTHNRFSHSLGAMNICDLYCKKLMDDGSLDYYNYRLLRLASLLHDIAHGPFSHQFDETIYKSNNYPNGHDDFRKKVITEFIPYFLKKKILKEQLKEGLKQESIETELFDFSNLIGSVSNLLEQVLKIYEDTNSYKFAIVQGTLGADRLDFIWRDSYFSGIKGFSKGDIERIVFNSFVVNGNLVYHVKAIDEIFSALYGRFMLYKNLYFHKTARAADLMIQKMLEKYQEIVDFKYYLDSPENFLLLTDDYIMNLHYILEYKNFKNQEIKSKLIEIKEIIYKIRSRDLWKMKYQKYVYEEEKIHSDHSNFDLTEELNIYARKGTIFLFDGSNIMTIEDFLNQNPMYKLEHKIRIFRVYE